MQSLEDVEAMSRRLFGQDPVVGAKTPSQRRRQIVECCGIVINQQEHRRRIDVIGRHGVARSGIDAYASMPNDCR